MQNASQQQTTGLYIGNLDDTITTSQLYQFFLNYNVINIHHPFDQVRKKSKSFAFAYFNNEESGILTFISWFWSQEGKEREEPWENHVQ